MLLKVIFFGTETAGGYDGTSDWSTTRVLSMNTDSELYIYPTSNTAKR